MKSIINEYEKVVKALEHLVGFFTENHNALNHLPEWVWNKEITGIDFGEYKTLALQARQHLKELQSQSIDVNELIRMNRNPARRLMFMVNELHNLGYQKIRFYPHIGGAGFWRYIITVSSRPKRPEPSTDPKTFDTIWQSLGDGNHPYGWDDKEDDSIQILANKFLDKHETIKKLGKGDDHEYVRWYQSMLEKTEPDGIIYFWWDGDFKSNRSSIGILNCGEKRIKIPYPSDYPKTKDSHYPSWILT